MDGLLGPDVEMLGPVQDGGHIVVDSTPGCWGRMITPSSGRSRGSPAVAVAGAEPGDGIAIRRGHRGHLDRDGLGQRRSPHESSSRSLPRGGLPWYRQESREKHARWDRPGVGALRRCGAQATPFTFTNGYTIAFDDVRSVGVTVRRESAEGFAGGHGYAACQRTRPESDPRLRDARPRGARPAATAVHGPARTAPSKTIAGLPRRRRLRLFLVGAPHATRSPPRSLPSTAPTATWTSTRSARERSSSAPSSWRARLYLGDMHALQGDRQDRGDTCDASGTVTLQVELLTGSASTGPCCSCSRRSSYLPGRCAARSAEARRGSRARGARRLQESPPISVAARPGPQQRHRQRAQARSRLLGLTAEVKNRARHGAIEIGVTRASSR